MKKKLNVLYVHGYMGKENGSTSELLRKCLIDYGIDANVYAPSIPVDNPKEAMRTIEKLMKDYDIVVSSSLGAFYSMIFEGKPKVIINPADPRDLKGIDAKLIDDGYNELEKIKKLFKFACDYDLANELYLILGDDDNVAIHNRWIRDFVFDRNIIEVPNMGHKPNYEGMEKVINIIKNLFD